MKKLQLLLLVFFPLLLNGQQNNTLFLMHDLPQANIVNPAVGIKCKWFIGVPGIASSHANASSTAFSYNDILVPSVGDSMRYDFTKAIDKFGKNEIVASQTHLSLLWLGYSAENNYFTLGVNEKVNSYSLINKNAALLIHGGNAQFEGQNITMKGTRVNVIHYREYALGWARQIDAKLSFGLRFKMLFGKANIYTKPIDINIYTHPITFETNASVSGEMYTSFPADVSTMPDGTFSSMELKQDINTSQYLMYNGNVGFGGDFGFIYQLNPKTTLSGSLLDIGYINWKKDAYYLNRSGAIDITALAIENGLENLGEISDSLKSAFNPYVNSQSYISPLVPAVYLGVTHTLNDWLSAGAVVYTEVYQNRIHPSFTLSANATISKNIYGSASYTLQNGEFNILGAGIGATFGILHLHVVSDNIPALFDLGAAQSINMRFGLAMLIGCGRENKYKGNNGSDIKALPCYNDPYKSKVEKQRRRR